MLKKRNLKISKKNQSVTYKGAPERLSPDFSTEALQAGRNWHEIFKVMKNNVLAGVAKWIEHQPENQKVAGTIPSQGIHLGCRPGCLLGACERQLINVSFIIVSLSLSPSPPFSLKISKSFKE